MSVVVEASKLGRKASKKASKVVRAVEDWEDRYFKLPQLRPERCLECLKVELILLLLLFATGTTALLIV